LSHIIKFCQTNQSGIWGDNSKNSRFWLFLFCFKNDIIYLMKKKKNWTNQEIAELLKAVAAAYEVKGESKFKTMAYDRAATSIEHLTAEIKDVWDEGKIDQIPGVGGSIAQHLQELFEKGESLHFKRVMKGLPPAMFELLKLAGIGPKTAFKLCQHLKIWKKKNVFKRVKTAAQKGKIRVIPGFGEESEQNILRAIEKFDLKKKEKARMLLPFAYQLALKIIEYLKKSPDVLGVEPLGSLRRKCATVGDIDLAVKTRKPSQVVDYFLRYPLIKQILGRGSKKASVILKNEVQVDLRTQDPGRWGSMLQYFTGSKHHNIHLRELALKKNLSLSEYGVKDLAKKRLIRTATEKEFYRLLGLPLIPPEIREDQGEIEAALARKLPRLVILEDIKGDLHMHSNFNVEPSHDLGEDSFETMVKKASELGYEYIGFSEHNPSLSQHSPSQILSILSRKRDEIEKINFTSIKNLNIRVLNALEIDIRPNGQLAIPLKALDLLDYAIAAVHTSFQQSRKKMTQRILTGLQHPRVKILAHPTGRKLNLREGYEVDWEKIFAFCRQNDKILEINAFPDRLDLPDFLVREAIKAGVKLIINTDSHQVDHLDLMTYGIAVARRGWATKRNIVNTASWQKFCKILEIKERG